MLLRFIYFSPFLNRDYLFLYDVTIHSFSHRRFRYSLSPFNANPYMNPPSKSSFLSTIAALILEPSPLMSNKANKKARRESAEVVLQFKLDKCSQDGNLYEALKLYHDAKINNVHLSVHHYNVLLYLCSSNTEGLDRGFKIFKEVNVKKIDPNEATFTSTARLAVSKEDPEIAFELIKKMKSVGILPKLRSYGSALFGFCNLEMDDKAYDVDAHIVDTGILAEETDLRALLKVSIEAKSADKVYEMMQRFRATVRQVNEGTAEVIENWFRLKTAEEIGEENWDAGNVKEGVVKGGGGWHRQGWLRTRKWKVVRTEMEESGIFLSCGEKLVAIDIDPRETENFVASLTTLDCQREVDTNFTRFQESEQGSWHVPTVTGNNVRTPRQWLCATRSRGRFYANLWFDKMRKMRLFTKICLYVQ